MNDLQCLYNLHPMPYYVCYLKYVSFFSKTKDQKPDNNQVIG
jgi:hypothetical protein